MFSYVVRLKIIYTNTRLRRLLVITLSLNDINLIIIMILMWYFCATSVLHSEQAASEMVNVCFQILEGLTGKQFAWILLL